MSAAGLARSLAAGAAAALCSVGVVGVVVVGQDVAAGASPPLPPGSSAPASASLALRGHSYAVAPGEQLTVRLTLGGDAVALAEQLDGTMEQLDTANQQGGGDVLSFTVHAAVSSLAELDEALDGPTAGAVIQAVDAKPGNVAFRAERDGVVDIDLAIPVVDTDAAEPNAVASANGGPVRAALVLSEPGIHPITIAASGAELRSVIRVLDRTAPPPPVSVAVLLGVDDPGPFPSAAVRASTRVGISGLLEVAEQVSAPLSLLLPPAAARIYDAAPSPGGLPLASGFANDMLLARTANGIDPSATNQGGADELFSTDLRDGDDQLARIVPLAATRRTVWYVDGQISRPAAAFLRLVGVRMLLFETGQGPDPTRPSAPFNVDVGERQRMTGISATEFDTAGRLLPPIGAARANDERSGARDAAEAEHSPAVAAARLIAGAELHAGDQGTSALVLTPAHGELPDAPMLASFAGHVQRNEALSFVNVAALANVAEREVRREGVSTMVLPETAGADLGPRLSGVRSVRQRVEQARSMLVDPDYGSDWDARITASLSALATDVEADAALAAVKAEADAIVSALVPPEPVPFTLTGTDTPLHFTVGNRADTDLRAMVGIRSAKLEQLSAPEERIIPAGGTETFDVAVRARSNGTFSVVVDVFSPDGQRIASTFNIKASVTRLTGLGQVVSGSLILVLASWWYSHFRRRSRAAAAAREAVAAQR